MKRSTQIFIGLVAGVAIGLGARFESTGLLVKGLGAIEPVGTMFIRLVSMVIVPLVIASLFVGITSLSDVRQLGRIGGRTLAYFLATTLSGAVIGTAIGVALGVGRGIDAGTREALAGMPNANATASAMPSGLGFVQTLLGFVPQNPFAAAAQGELLPLIVAVLFFAAATMSIAAERRRPLVAFFEGVNDASMVVIGWVMRLAPVAVFVLVGVNVARGGGQLLAALAWFAAVVVAALVLHVSLVLIPLLRAGAGFGVTAFFRGVSDALLLAFSTASSNATLPVSMAAARNRLGVPNEIASFVLPVGTTLNKNGAAVYKAVTAVFVAQLFLVPLDAGRILMIIFASTIASFAGAGVPGSSLVTTLIVLNASGLGTHAAAAIALVAGIDRPLDMCRTTVNTIGNLVGTVWLTRREAAGTASGLATGLSAART